MSKERKTIELTAPDSAGTKKEELVSRWHTCNYCNGFAYVVGSDSQGGRDYVKCPVCHGTGKMKATITICWEPEQQDKTTKQ